jgi:hypothetical protein
MEINTSNLNLLSKNNTILNKTSNNKVTEDVNNSIIDANTIVIDEIQISKNVNSTSLSGNSQYMPTRIGFSSANIALGVTSPGAQPFSQNRLIIDVANSARQSIDAKYAQMNQSGQKYNVNSFEGKDSYSAFGDLDRRALFAIKSNIGGQFSQEEQDFAQSIMVQQEGLAMGLYTGPASKNGDFADRFMGNDAARFKSYGAFLDSVSPEEKASGDWILARNGADKAYQSIIENEEYRKKERGEKDYTLIDMMMEISKTHDEYLEEMSEANDKAKMEINIEEAAIA